MNEARQSATTGRCPLQRTDLKTHELDGEALIYDPASADTHHLNQTALFIWGQCNGGRDAARIARRLADSYHVAREAAVDHVERILNEFQERDLIVAMG